MKKKPNPQYRQGDVLIVRVDKIEITEEAPRENGRVILAHGEVTGHAHALCEPGIRKGVEKTEQRQGPILVSDLEVQEALALLEHDEHSTIALPADKYRVIRQREYTPEAIRNVAD